MQVRLDKDTASAKNRKEKLAYCFLDLQSKSRPGQNLECLEFITYEVVAGSVA